MIQENRAEIDTVLGMGYNDPFQQLVFDVIKYVFQEMIFFNKCFM